MATTRQSRPDRAGFTIIELLVVVGVILILISILLPVMQAVQKKARQADSMAFMTKISTAINNYYTDYSAFPGPEPDTMVFGWNTPSGGPTPTTGAGGGTITYVLPSGSTNTSGTLTTVTSSQNLVLGLVGGLTQINPATNSAPLGMAFFFDPNLDANNAGPQSLAPGNAAARGIYIDTVAKRDLTTDQDGNPFTWCNNKLRGLSPAVPASSMYVPEFIDHFSNPHPIIYLRARAGATTMVDVAVGSSAPTGSQYYSMEMSPYWWGTAAPASGTTIPGPPNAGGNPFPSTVDPATQTAIWTTATAFFQSPTINDGITPRGKDSFILISAGADGIYGTNDDIIMPN